MQLIAWERDVIFRWKGTRFLIQVSEGKTAVFAQRLNDGHFQLFQLQDLTTWLEEGELVIEHQPTAQETRQKTPTEFIEIPTHFRKQAKKRLEIIRPLLKRPRFGRKRAEEIGEQHGVHWRTLYRWVRDYRSYGYKGLIPQWAFARQYDHVWKDLRAKAIWDEILTRLYRKKIKPSKSYVIKQFEGACDAGLVRPRRSTLFRIFKTLPPDEETLDRDGEQAHDKKFGAHFVQYASTRSFPLEHIQIDHTLLDISLVDELLGVPIGRPWLTLGYDLYSRMPWGYYLSYHRPNIVSLMMCLRHGVLLKHSKDLFGTESDWPVYGIPKLLTVDNGKEFHSTYFNDVTADLNIWLRYRPRRKSYFGGAGERGFGTLNTELLHNLRGNTKTMKNVKFKSHLPDDEAVWTLPLLDIALTTYFTDIYPHEEHDGLKGRTPFSMWLDGLNIGGFPSSPLNRDDFLRLTLPTETRHLSRQGVKRLKTCYHDTLLRPLVGRHKSITIKWDPLDVSYILVWDPEHKEWIRARTTDEEYAGTLMRHREVRKWVKAKGLPWTRDVVRCGYRRLDELEKQAHALKDSNTKDIRRQIADSRRVHLSPCVSEGSARPKQATTTPTNNIPLPPLEDL